MFKSLIVSAIVAGGAYAAGAGALPLPFLDTPPAVSAPAAAQLPTVAAVAPVATCGQTQDAVTQAAKAADVPQTTPQTAAAPPAAVAGQAGLVNLNTASESELEALPGIGKATVAKIVKARPIASVDDVAKLPGVTGTNFALFAAKVTV